LACSLGDVKETSMNLMDKMKEQAAQALNKAQQGVSQGKAKIDEAQAKHQWDGLLRSLGAAVYAEQREGGSSEAVTAALSALDAQAVRARAEAADGASDGADDVTSTNDVTSTGAVTSTGDVTSTGEGSSGDIATGQASQPGPAESEVSGPGPTNAVTDAAPAGHTPPAQS
jgi:hypothetical protein